MADNLGIALDMNPHRDTLLVWMVTRGMGLVSSLHPLGSWGERAQPSL